MRFALALRGLFYAPPCEPCIAHVPERASYCTPVSCCPGERIAAATAGFDPCVPPIQLLRPRPQSIEKRTVSIGEAFESYTK